ncbi:hypothetical protein HMPREF1014_02610, partial [Bacillus sp. 7_6_55CFAA_CT2]
MGFILWEWQDNGTSYLTFRRKYMDDYKDLQGYPLQAGQGAP